MHDWEEEALAAELKSLVGWGATPERLARLPVLLAHPVVQARMPEQATDRTRGRIIGAVLTECVDELTGDYELPGIDKRLPAGQLREAALLLLALTPASRAYAAPRRRERAIQALSLKYLVTVEQWRRPGGLELALMRLLAQELLRREAVPTEDTGYKVNHFQITCLLTDQASIAKQEIVQEITAARDGISRITNRWIYPTDRRAGVITVTPLVGCELVEQTYSEDRPGLVTATFAVPPLAAGSRHTLAYALTLNTQQVAEPHLSYEPAVPIDRLTMRLRFSRGRLPRRVWWFAGISAIYVPGEPTPETSLPLIQDGWYSKTFLLCQIGSCYGLGWRFS